MTSRRQARNPNNCPHKRRPYNVIAALLALAILAIGQIAHAWQPTLAFWQTGSQVFATVNSSDLIPQISNDLRTRSVVIGGWGISEYKAIVINSGTCSSPGVAATLLAAPTVSFAVPFTFTPPGGTTDDYFTVCVIGKNFIGVWQNASTPTPSYTLRLNTILPVVQSFALNNGTTPTTLASVPVSFSATHSNLNITHFCFKTRISAVAPTTPAPNDACWLAVNNPSPGQLPSTAVSFSGFIYSLGFQTATYTVFAWAKVQSGAVSYLSALGNGTDATDKASIQFFQSQPPVLANVLATQTDSPSTPLTQADLTVPAGGSVYIKWNLSDDNALPVGPVSLSYTTDEVNYTSIASNLSNTTNGACTVDGVSYTGCYRWANGSPLSTYYKVRVTAIDDSNIVASASAPPINTTPFKIIAGNTDPGLGTSASSAVLFPANINEPVSLQAGGTFVVTDEGVIYLSDRRGLMRITPTDGLLNLLIPVTGAATNGPVASAGLITNPVKLALDYQGGLLIYDYDRIRRLNLSTGIVSTLIGGGGSTVDQTLASNYSIYPTTSYYSDALMLVPLPNGDIWFTDLIGVTRDRNTGAKILVYKASDQKIYHKIPTGVGSLEDPAFDPTARRLKSFGISFNPVNSQVLQIRTASVVPTPGSEVSYSVSYDPVTMQTTTPHVKYANYYGYDNTITTSLGEMYSVSRFVGGGLRKYDSGTNTWPLVVGTGIRGHCADGTDALLCDVDLTDAYITPQGLIYLVDRNQIRTVDSNGKILTLFGQELSFGDGQQATSARVNQVLWIDRTSDGKITFIDNAEGKLREFTPGGLINRLAGLGSERTPNTTASALSQNITVKYWGGHFPFVIDRATNDVLFTRDGAIMAKLDRGTGKWVDIAGGGPTPYQGADGLAGSQMHIPSYATAPLGTDGSSYLLSHTTWDGTQYINVMMKEHSLATTVQSAFGGLPGAYTGASLYDCLPGTNLSACTMPPNFNYLSRVEWDSTNSLWNLHLYGAAQVLRANAAKTVTDLITLPRAALATVPVDRSGVPHIYYCATNTRMYKYNVTTLSETELPWPTSTIGCHGFSITWDPARSTVVFPVRQNGLEGVAEIYDP